MTFVPFIIGIAVLFIILKILSMPMKIIIKFIINAVVRWSSNICTQFAWCRSCTKLDYSTYCWIFRSARCYNSCNFTICFTCDLNRRSFHYEAK